MQVSRIERGDGMRMMLSVTHRCNLACSYCYAGHATPSTMSLATAHKAVDFAFAHAASNEPIEFSFGGGEPLLCVDLLKATITYIRDQQARYHQPVRLQITTNGTICDAGLLQWLQAEAIALTISLDGPPEVQNRYRSFRHGEGSFAIVKANLAWALAELPTVQVNTVYGPEMLPFLPEVVAYLVELGVRALQLLPDLSATWPDTAFAQLDPVFQAIAAAQSAGYAQGQALTIDPIDSKIRVILAQGYAPAVSCALPRTQWAVAPSGNLYPSEEFIGEDDALTFYLGNLQTPFDPNQPCRLLNQIGKRTQACQSCPLHDYCQHGCACRNYYMTGQADQADTLLCAVERATIHAATQVLTTLAVEQNAPFRDQFDLSTWRGLSSPLDQALHNKFMVN